MPVVVEPGFGGFGLAAARNPSVITSAPEKMN